jgi:hypothetical protein
LSAGKIRGKILVELWLAEKPLTLKVLSEKIGLPSSSTMGYLLGLIKAKYVFVPQKHYYAITNIGKKAIGLPQLDKELAQKILRSVPLEESFNFYNEVDDYSGHYSDSLNDFVEKIMIVNSKSLLFHISRKDFENWINSLGDVELSKKIGIIRTINLDGENLRKKLYQTIKSRSEKLAKLIE